MSFSALSSKTPLTLLPLLLLPYSFNTLALSATTANTIQGTAPYLTFDNGTTKVTTTDGLLGITLSDGSTPAPNLPTPITLPAAGETFADIEMLVPPTASPVSPTDPTQIINLNDLIGAPYNYWGDDDGDGQGAAGISATGSLSVVITDKNGTKMNRSDMPSACSAPYKVVLTSTAGSLSTQYGDPSSSAFTAANATYLINPAVPAVCFAKPDMTYATGNYAGPASMWDTTKGFIPQSTTPAAYGSNFPTTGANGLYFDLDIAGLDTALTWDPVTVNGITATMTAATPTSVTVTLTGPTTAIPPAPFATTGSTFELEGKSGSTTVVKYGFEIKKWYVATKWVVAVKATTDAWCTDRGYRPAKAYDLTNEGYYWFANMSTPRSTGNYYMRYIGAGLFSEWGYMWNYTGSDFIAGSYRIDEVAASREWVADARDGATWSRSLGDLGSPICATP